MTTEVEEATSGSATALNWGIPCSNEGISNSSSDTEDTFLCGWVCRGKDTCRVTELEYGWGVLSHDQEAPGSGRKPLLHPNTAC